MRAPPSPNTMTSARRSAIAASIEAPTFSPTTEPMLPPMKKKVHHRDRHRLAAQGRDPRQRRVLHAGVELGGAQPLGIGELGVAKLERVAGLELGVTLLERPRVDQIAHVVLGRHRK